MARTKNKGFFYLLKAIDENGLFVYKYGATTSSIKNRISWANTKGKLKFELFYKQNSKDVFDLENSFKWKLTELAMHSSKIINWSHTHKCGEFFAFIEDLSELLIKMVNEKIDYFEV
ncbi:MAG: hypothetical protein DRH97_00010 [Chloroflexi bacterium]|nr:MAG: hypothetical protein DRH97_00010 [Chloroflexota bacterium]